MTSEAWRKEFFESWEDAKKANQAYDKVRRKMESYGKTGKIAYLTDEDPELLQKLKEATEKHIKIARNPY